MSKITPRLQKAVRFATAAHAGHYRKGTTVPYINHLLRVMNTLLDKGYPEDVAIAGLLHDCVEDAGVHPNSIEEKFGSRVLELVLSATEPAKIPGNPTKADGSWSSRKEHTFHLLESIQDEEVLAVAIADKLDNMQAIALDVKVIGDQLWKRFNAPKEKQAWYYSGLADIFEAKTPACSTAFAELSSEFSSLVKQVFVHQPLH
jgi:(p)ppGpp synthase/HD superfamily hydrolase